MIIETDVSPLRKAETVRFVHAGPLPFPFVGLYLSFTCYVRWCLYLYRPYRFVGLCFSIWQYWMVHLFSHMSVLLSMRLFSFFLYSPVLYRNDLELKCCCFVPVSDSAMQLLCPYLWFHRFLCPYLWFHQFLCPYLWSSGLVCNARRSDNATLSKWIVYPGFNIYNVPCIRF